MLLTYLFCDIYIPTRSDNPVTFQKQFQEIEKSTIFHEIYSRSRPWTAQQQLLAPSIWDPTIESTLGEIEERFREKVGDVSKMIKNSCQQKNELKIYF